MEEFKTYKSFVKENTTSEYRGCIMIDLDIKNWEKITDSILETGKQYSVDWAKEGIEKNPHITLHYGINNTETKLEDLENWCRSWLEHLKEIEYSIKTLDTFENEEYDVVKYNMEHLRKYLNPVFIDLTQKFDCHIEYPQYNPHLTVGFVEKGFGLNLKNENPEPLKVNFSQIRITGFNKKCCIK